MTLLRPAADMFFRAFAAIPAHLAVAALIGPELGAGKRRWRHRRGCSHDGRRAPTPSDARRHTGRETEAALDGEILADLGAGLSLLGSRVDGMLMQRLGER